MQVYILVHIVSIHKYRVHDNVFCIIIINCYDVYSNSHSFALPICTYSGIKHSLSVASKSLVLQAAGNKASSMFQSSNLNVVNEMPPSGSGMDDFTGVLFALSSLTWDSACSSWRSESNGSALDPLMTGR